MKLMTFVADREPMVGVLTRRGRVASLSRAELVLRDGAPTMPSTLRALLELGGPGLDRARELTEAVDDAESSGRDLLTAWGERVVYQRSEVRLLCPIPEPRKFIGIGLNYRDHAKEQGAKIPAAPIVFAKFANSLIGPNDDIRYPRITEQLDYEAELGVVIGLQGRDIAADDAHRHIAGYCVVNDVTARDVQLRDRQWVRGKTLDAMTPVGPFLTTSDEVENPESLWIRLWLNDELMQDSTTRQLIFGISALIQHISQDITLEPGDIIATGTPGGVGFVRDPAVFMRHGDTVEVEVEGLGRLRNRVVR